MHRMLICFAEPVAQFGSFFNNAAAWLTGGRFCHVAIVFEIQNASGLWSFSEVVVVKTGHADLDVVRFCEVEDFTGWTCFRLTFNDHTVERHCFDYVKAKWEGKPYDKVGSVMDFTLFSCCPRGYRTLSSKDPDNKTYCSRLALRILQECGQFAEHSPEKVSPNEVYKMIKKDNQTNPGKWEDVSSTANAILQNKHISIFRVPKQNGDGSTSYFQF